MNLDLIGILTKFDQQTKHIAVSTNHKKKIETCVYAQPVHADINLITACNNLLYETCYVDQ